MSQGYFVGLGEGHPRGFDSQSARTAAISSGMKSPTKKATAAKATISDGPG